MLVLGIVFWVLNVYTLPQWDCILLNATSGNFPVEEKLQTRSAVQQSTCAVSGCSGISAVGSLYHLTAGNGAFSVFQLFNGTSVNPLVRQTVPLPGKTATILCIFQDCLLRKLLKLVWQWSHTLKLAYPQEAGLSLTIWGRVELWVTFPNWGKSAFLTVELWLLI